MEVGNFGLRFSDISDVEPEDVDVAKTTVWIVMKIKWFSLIHVIVNCSVWSAVAATYTRNGQA